MTTLQYYAESSLWDYRQLLAEERSVNIINFDQFAGSFKSTTAYKQFVEALLLRSDQHGTIALMDGDEVLCYFIPTSVLERLMIGEVSHRILRGELPAAEPKKKPKKKKKK